MSEYLINFYENKPISQGYSIAKVDYPLTTKVTGEYKCL